MIVYEVADVGNDRAVEFLLRVAKSDADYNLRSDAVYYLGNIGGDKARTALYEILKSK
jgi:HEAT repeat protein